MSQIDKLKKLSNRMIDVVLNDADPETWAGAGKNLNELTSQERGDRYWCGKNANQMITAAVKLETLIALHERKGSEVPKTVMEQVEDSVVKFEREAKKRLDKLGLQGIANA